MKTSIRIAPLSLLWVVALVLSTVKAGSASSATTATTSIESLRRSLQANPNLQTGRQRSTTLTNDSLRSAVELWLGDDHNKAEVTALLGPIQSWDTSQVTDFSSLFKGATSLRDEDLSQWNTERVTDMSDMFNGATNYRGIPTLQFWNTKGVTTMARMFKSASSLDSVDLSMFNTESVTDMTSIFQVRSICLSVLFVCFVGLYF